MWTKKLLLIIFFVLSVSYSFPQTKSSVSSRPIPAPAPGNIKLLPEYIHERKRGVDSARGVISKKDGLVINYDIGRMAGNYANRKIVENKKNIVWQKQEKINDDDLLIAYFKDGKIVASFNKESANFFAETRSEKDVADFLEIIKTYNPNKK
ncbi:MAG: hypothetical protein M3T96_00025 [Acidobacteriota bacterium]|nr:hypothetical protein [Acidobacteriota bacterium]